MFTTFIQSVLDDPGPLATLGVALIAGLFALRIAALNARRTTEHETIVSVRAAYAEWFEAVTAFAHHAALESNESILGQKYRDEIEMLYEEGLKSLELNTKLVAATAKIRVLDPNPPEEINMIGHALSSRKWDRRLGPFDESGSIENQAHAAAGRVLTKVAYRLLSRKPFRGRGLRFFWHLPAETTSQ